MNEVEFSEKTIIQTVEDIIPARGIACCVSRLGALLRFSYPNTFGAGAVDAASGFE
jgi:hypothetical protein